MLNSTLESGRHIKDTYYAPGAKVTLGIKISIVVILVLVFCGFKLYKSRKLRKN